MTLKQRMFGIAYVVGCGLGATLLAGGDPVPHQVGNWTFTYKPGVPQWFIAGGIGGFVLLVVDAYVRRRFRLGGILQVDERIK